jgi:TolA-binding protein
MSCLSRRPFIPCLRRLLCVSGLLLLPLSALAQREASNADQAFGEAFKLYTDRLFEQSVTAFSAFRAQHPTHINAPEALYYEAEASLALGREEEALHLFTLFREQYPAHPLAFQARLALGKYFFDQLEYDRALEVLRLVVAERPPYEVGAKALYWMGEAALMLGRTDEALGYYRQAADDYRYAETAPTALYALAFTQVRLEQYEEAAQAFEQLADRYPHSPRAQNMGLALAEIYYELNDYRRTVSEIQRREATLSGEARDRAIFLMAESYNQLRDSPNAIVQYRRLTEGASDNPYYRQALYGLGWNYYREDAYQWAAEAFEQARQGHDDRIAERATYYRAVTLQLNSQPLEAAPLFAEVAERWPRSELADHALQELGLLNYEQRRWDDARQALEQLVTAYPDSPLYGEAQYHLGNTYVALADFDAAIAAYDAAIAAGSAPASLRDELVFQKAWLLYRAQRYPEAGPAFMALYQQNPRAPRASEALFWAAESFYQNEQLNLAERHFQQYLTDFANGRYANAARYALGWTYFKRSQYAEAARTFELFLRNYQETTEQVPYRQDAQLRLADSYFALRRYADAVRIYNRAAQEGEDYAMYQLGQAYANAGNTFDAITTLRRLLSDYPETAWREEAQFSLGDMYFRSEDYDRAITEYRKVLTEYPRDPLAAKAQYAIGDALFNAGRSVEAIDAYEQVLRQYPDSPFAADAAAAIQYALVSAGDEERAQAVLDSFAVAHPDSPALEEMRFRQVEARYQAGQKQEALLGLQTFIQTARTPTFLPDAHYYAGAIYASDRLWPESETHLRRVIEEYPQSQRRGDAARLLGQGFLARNRHEQALDAYRVMEQAQAGEPTAVAEARYGQSQALLGLGRTSEAEQLLLEIITAAPNDPATAPAQLGLARLHEQQGRTADAQRLYQQVARRSTDDTGAEALLRLGDLLLRTDNPRGTLEELARMERDFAGYPDWVAQGLLAQARAHARLNQKQEALRLYDRLIQEYGNTPWATTALQEKGTL